jgi:hypothetical protein
MFGNGYAASKTPWLTDAVVLDACYAQTKTGTFLALLTLGRNTYPRTDRNKDQLTWEQNYEPEYEQQAIHQVLYGQDSAKRKLLLMKIRASFQGLDVTRYPAKRKEVLSLQLQRCEDDQDPAVVTLARELQKALSMMKSKP